MTHYQEIVCPDCGMKAGRSASGMQRYRCDNAECATKSFMLEYRYRAYKPGIKAQLVDMAINGSGIRCWSQVQPALVPLDMPPTPSWLMCLANGRMTSLKTQGAACPLGFIYARWVHR